MARKKAVAENLKSRTALGAHAEEQGYAKPGQIIFVLFRVLRVNPGFFIRGETGVRSAFSRRRTPSVPAIRIERGFDPARGFREKRLAPYVGDRLGSLR